MEVHEGTPHSESGRDWLRPDRTDPHTPGACAKWDVPQCTRGGRGGRGGDGGGGGVGGVGVGGKVRQGGRAYRLCALSEFE